MSHCPILTPVGCGLQARQQPPSLGPPFLGVEGGSACELGPRSTGWAANSLPPGPGSTPALPTYRPCPFVIFPAPAPRPGLLLPLGLPAPRSHPQVSSVSRGSGHPSAAGACLVRVSPTPGDIHFPPRSAPGSAGPPGPHLQPTLGPSPAASLDWRSRGASNCSLERASPHPHPVGTRRLTHTPHPHRARDPAPCTCLCLQQVPGHWGHGGRKLGGGGSGRRQPERGVRCARREEGEPGKCGRRG